MGQFNFRKHYAIKTRYDQTIGKDIPHSAGIYLGKREDGDITYFYVGQTKDLNKRRFDYYSIQCGLSYPTRHFEASLKKHKDGEFRIIILCEEFRLDELEKYYINLFNAMPNHITRNELLAGKDIVKSNSKRIKQVEKKYENNIKKMLKHLNISIEYNYVVLKVKTNKDDTDNKQSVKAFQELTNGLKGLIENDNQGRN